MPSFNPFNAGHRNACTLFEIRLDNDFIVFRGNEHEAAGQLLKGVLVLCLREPIKAEDVHLRLMGNCRIAWIDTKQTPTGIHSQKVDKTTTILRHSWDPFFGGPNSQHHTLAAGNYEWPFELLLPGDTAESVEGLYQTSISYHLKATISRGKLAKNHHAFKRVRIIRTLDPTALEFNHAMSVENIWPNKIEYSVVIPQKALVFGSIVPVEMRFTPLLKGLDMGEITVKLLETQEFSVPSSANSPSRTHKSERDVCTWTFEVNKEENWADNIEETGQDGWMVKKELPLPKKLTKCLQDCTVHGIKIRHKVKLTVALKNPDGHISELRATLPVTIFISPNMPLDDEGNIVSQDTTSSSNDTTANNENTNMAPPGYGQHILDQLYDDVEPIGMMTPGMMTPGGLQSGFASPFYSQSRAGSSENLAALANSAITPAALSSRLQNVSLDPSHRNTSFTSVGSHSHSGTATPYLFLNDGEHTADSSQPHSRELSRQTSAEEHHSGDVSGHSTPPEHIDLEQLSKVPSYTTATRTPLPRTSSFTGLGLPDYFSAMTSAPSSPTRNPLHDPLSTITEGSQADPAESQAQAQTEPNSRSHSRSNSHNRRSHSSLGFSFLHRSTPGDHHGERHLRLTQKRNEH